jgi:hypothetical protein
MSLSLPPQWPIGKIRDMPEPAITGASAAPHNPHLLQAWKELRAAAPRSSWPFWCVAMLNDGALLWTHPTTLAQVRECGKAYEVKKTIPHSSEEPARGWQTRTWTSVPTLSYALALAELG